MFSNQSNCEQAPVYQQLQCALYKLGHDGSASSYIQSASYWGVSEGHMYKTTSRVVEALCNLKDKVTEWPTEDEKRMESMKNDFREGFLGCVGKPDGTDIVLKNKPGGAYNGEIFFTRKKKYALDLCAVCNSSKRFIYILAGWPNSQHDARIYSSTNLQRHPENYFAPSKYLLDNAAYTNTSHLVSPYKSPLTNEKQNRRFNRKLCRIRIDIEHAFGIFKGRWGSLTRLRLLLKSKESYKFAFIWIIACCVLHNLLLDLKDDWERHKGWWTIEEEEEHDEELLLLS